MKAVVVDSIELMNVLQTHIQRRRSAAGRLPGSWVRIPPGHGCLSLAHSLCCQVSASATGRSLVQRSPTECGVRLSVIK
jgi:hypothetical protein